MELSVANTATPTGTPPGERRPPPDSAACSTYARNACRPSYVKCADDAPDRVNQYTLTIVSRSSTGTPASVQSVNFSPIQASCPTGESVSEYASVDGRV